MSQQSLGEYLRHGQTPFFRLPLAELARGGSTAYAHADAVLLGVPYDSGTTYQPGARLGPYHLRRTSALVPPYHPIHGVNVLERLRVVDGGNVPAPPFHAAAMRELVQHEIANVLAAGAAPFVAGGDHTITLPILRAIAAVHGPVAILHVDAHFDTTGPEAWGESYHHGTPIRNAIEEGLVQPGRLFQVGVRGSWKDAHDADFSRAFGGEIVGADELEARGVAATGAAIRDAFDGLPVYLTFDIDAVDPAFAPGTGTPIPGGLTTREVFAFLRSLAGLRIVGMDLVEVAPALDHADITSLLGAHILFEGLALVASTRADRDTEHGARSTP